MSKWTKTSPWGNYRDPKQNHKTGNESYISIVTQAQRICKYGKHVGSKTLKQLMGHIRGVMYDERKN